MSPDVFIDTNVLLYSVESQVSDKRERSQAWLRACWTRRC